MRTTHPLWRVSFAGLGLWLAAAAPAQSDRLLTDAELKALDRENEMWREVRADQNVAANVARLKQKGYTDQEMQPLRSRLEALWDVPYERNFGWLHEDTVRQIETIDRGFIIRMRALRVYRAVGIRLASYTPIDEDALNRLWHRAILRALDYDEIAEFRLMNSASAREVSRRVEGLKLSADELRTLFAWQREFENRSRGYTALSFTVPVALREEQLDDWQRTRDLLGDERFVVYLGRANGAFTKMQEVLARSGPLSATVALDLWWLRQKDGPARDAIVPVPKRDEVTARMRVKAGELLGEERLAQYSQDPDARWIVIPERPQIVVPRRPDSAVRLRQKTP